VLYGFKKRGVEFCGGGHTWGVQLMREVKRVAKKGHPSCGKHMRPCRTWMGLNECGTGREVYVCDREVVKAVSLVSDLCVGGRWVFVTRNQSWKYRGTSAYLALSARLSNRHDAHRNLDSTPSPGPRAVGWGSLDAREPRTSRAMPQYIWTWIASRIRLISTVKVFCSFF
jgi:hypothetical protein